MLECPDCDGKGVILALGCGKKSPVALSFDCELCEKTGKINEKKNAWRKTGSLMKEERIERGLVLRKEARRRGMDPILLSKMERGIVEPVRG